MSWFINITFGSTILMITVLLTLLTLISGILKVLIILFVLSKENKSFFAEWIKKRNKEENLFDKYFGDRDNWSQTEKTISRFLLILFLLLIMYGYLNDISIYSIFFNFHAIEFKMYNYNYLPEFKNYDDLLLHVRMKVVSPEKFFCLFASRIIECLILFLGYYYEGRFYFLSTQFLRHKSIMKDGKLKNFLIKCDRLASSISFGLLVLSFLYQTFWFYDFFLF